MKKILSLVLNFIAIGSFAQKSDPYIFTYGGDTVFKSEFERIYNKNNSNPTATPDQKAVREYLDLYVNFKLKVKEAMAQGLDTSESFRSELEGYRKQLAQPYLVDKQVTDQLVNEAYDRMKQIVNASHILLMVSLDAAPKDTLAAYNRIMDIRKKILNGESFDTMAYRFSEDPSAKKNYGNLGYFSAFQMIYPFESAAYNTPVGSVSMPVRTQFGYHLVKVNDKKPAPGEIKVAHVMIKVSPTGTEEQKEEAKKKIYELHSRLKAGESFEELAKQYSEDYSTRERGGELNWFSGVSNMPASFKDAAFGMTSNGDFSEPVLTDYGWHILKRVDKKDVQPLSEILETVKSKVARDSRSELNKAAVIERIKKENNFSYNKRNLKKFIKQVDSNLVHGKWSAEKLKRGDKVLVTLGGENFLVRDFASYVEVNQNARPGSSVEAILNNMFKEYTGVLAFQYEEKHLPKKYPAFAHLMQEYKEGILLFELTDKKVWTKSLTDSVGLAEFHRAHKDKYMWKERATVKMFKAANEAVAKETKLLLKKGVADSTILKTINKSNPLNLVIQEGTFEKGENSILEKMPWTKGMHDVKNEKNEFVFVQVKALLPAEPKTLNEAKGPITNDYQTFLDKQWISELKATYPVKINEENLKLLYK